MVILNLEFTKIIYPPIQIMPKPGWSRYNLETNRKARVNHWCVFILIPLFTILVSLRTLCT